MKLTAKLVVVLVLAITVLFAIDGYYTVQREVQRQRADRQFAAKRIGTTLQTLWKDGQQQLARQVISQFNSRPSDFRIRQVRLESETRLAATIPVDKKDIAALLRGDVVSCYRVDSQGRGWFSSYVRIAVLRQPVGILEIFEPWPRPDQQFSGRIRHLLMITGLMALLGGLVVYFLGTEMVGRPLEQLIEKTRRVAKGDLSRELHLRGHDELTELAEALNAMCNQIEESRTKAVEEEQAKMATMQQLRHADRLRTVGGLASGMAHEMGTPLNVVSGRAGLIASNKLSPEEIVESANTIKTEAQRMTEILRQLLDFARRNTPQKTRVDLRQIAQQTLALLATLARKHNVTLHLDENPTEMPAWVDAGQIQQVLTNLVVNGIHSMPEVGQIDVAIDRQRIQPPADHGGPEGQFLRIDVRDQGVGIAADQRQHLFEPFYTTKDVGEGTGLGLSIAYGIVQEHGGWIGVESRPGEGSCFSVYLPEESES
jgi:two-component system NtrC family sensor kinase